VSSTQEQKQALRTELVRRLVELTPKKRLDAMLEEVDGRALVRSIPAEDVYATIIDVGLADSTEVVQLSTAEQFRTYVDLASWQKDRVDPLEVLHWLRAARGDDDDQFIAKLRGLDIELLELIFKKLTLIHDLEEDPDVATEGVTMETPEGKFLLEFTVGGADEAALRRLSFDLMTHNPFELARFLEAVRWDLPSELEEAAFQFRQARLQDLGFPALGDAARVFAWTDPDKVALPAVSLEGLASAGRVDFVAAAFRGLDVTERENLELEIRGLVNCVLVAEAAEPGDPAAVRKYSEFSRDYLDLGLEHLTGGNSALATDVVKEHTLRTIFQVGFSLTLKLRRRVEKVLGEPGSKFAETWLVLAEETSALNALLRRRPFKALKVSGAEPVPFRAKRELVEVEAVAERVRAQRSVFGALLGPSPAEIVARFGVGLAELTPQRLFAAVVARATVDGVVDVAPFPSLKLTELCARIMSDAGPSPTLLSSANRRSLDVLRSTIAGADAELELMINRVLKGLAADLGPAWLRDGRVDPKRVMALPIEGEIPL
jgi:hypothetical protein